MNGTWWRRAVRGRRTTKSQRRASRAAKQRRVLQLVRLGDPESLRRAGSIVANNPGFRWPGEKELGHLCTAFADD